MAVLRQASAASYAECCTALRGSHNKRRRDLETFEEKQRMELEQFQAKVRRLAAREKAPGAPTKRKPFFSF